MAPQPLHFDLPPPPTGKPRVTWDVSGYWLDDDGELVTVDGEPKRWTETYETIPVGTMPSALLVDLSVGVSIVDAQVRYDSRRVLNFLRATCRKADRLRFDAMVRDTERAVQTSALGDVAMGLIEALVGDPPGGPSNSPGGRPARKGSSGRGSKAKGNGAGSTD